MTEQDNLLPCPFCNGEARWVDEQDRIGEPFGLYPESTGRMSSAELAGLIFNATEAATEALAALQGQATPSDDAQRLISDLAKEPPGGEIWERSDRFAKYAERARAIKQGCE